MDLTGAASKQLGIPDLRPDRLSGVVPSSVWTRFYRGSAEGKVFIHSFGRWGHRAKGGILAFYAADYQIEAVWTRRESFGAALTAYGWAAVVTPDFSLWRDDPLIVQIYNIYRSRALAREWQDCGVQIIPSMNWSTPESWDYAFSGIPERAPVVMVQARTQNDQTARDLFLSGFAEMRRRLDPARIVVYGGRWLAGRELGPGVSFLPAAMDEIKREIAKTKPCKPRKESAQMDLTGVATGR